MSTLVVYQPNWEVAQYLPIWRARALKQRVTVNTWVQACSDQAESFISQNCAAEKRKLIEIRARIRALAKGIPLTEVLDEPLLEEDSPELDDAQQLLLKKAYKMAAQLCHPDHAISDADREKREAEFAALQQAYRAKDLKAIQELVLHLERSLIDQVQYWKDEEQRAQIRWVEFKQTVVFNISRDLTSGRDPEEVKQACIRYLTYLRHLLEAQHINAMAHKAKLEE